MTVVAGQYRAVLADFARSGTLHEVRDDASTPQRVDVLAQCSRVGDLLARQGLVTARDARDALVDRVMRAVRPDGSLPFSLEPRAHDRNVWAAMFVSQALQGVLVGRTQEAPLIV